MNVQKTWKNINDVKGQEMQVFNEVTSDAVCEAVDMSRLVQDETERTGRPSKKTIEMVNKTIYNAAENIVMSEAWMNIQAATDASVEEENNRILEQEGFTQKERDEGRLPYYVDIQMQDTVLDDNTYSTFDSRIKRPFYSAVYSVDKYLSDETKFKLGRDYKLFVEIEDSNKESHRETPEIDDSIKNPETFEDTKAEYKKMSDVASDIAGFCIEFGHYDDCPVDWLTTQGQNNVLRSLRTNDFNDLSHWFENISENSQDMKESLQARKICRSLNEIESYFQEHEQSEQLFEALDEPDQFA